MMLLDLHRKQRCAYLPYFQMILEMEVEDHVKKMEEDE